MVLIKLVMFVKSIIFKIDKIYLNWFLINYFIILFFNFFPVRVIKYFKIDCD